MTVKPLRAVTDADNAWQEIMAAGIRALAEQAIALRPQSVGMLVEINDAYKLLQFPPGEAAIRWMIRELATEAAEAKDE